MAKKAPATVYAPRQAEQRWYRFWEERGYFHSEPAPGRPRFCITIPPPNVTGNLHMGHALQHTIHDTLARWHRMQGENVLILPGMDHAGIPTQMLVERQLTEEGLSRHQLGRERFLERMWQWKEEYGGTILRQLRDLGCSYDWRREVFTLDPGYAQAVLTAFVRLYEQGYIYRGNRVINWCPRCHTALSDLEVRHEERRGQLWHIRYPFADGSGALTVATTRPETMLGDTAVAVNAADPRYQHLVGKTLILPLMGRQIPLIADATGYVDPQFGTGAVKVTPAHDPNDYEAGLRHHLPSVVVIGPDGKMTAQAGAYAGKDRFDARQAVVRDLQAQGYLERVEEHLHAVGFCDRCATMVEPLLSEQWFLAMAELVKPAIEATRQGRVRYVPERFAEMAITWMEGIRDWCLSRQIWWGQRIPIYYCSCGEVIAAVERPAACPKCGGGELEQENDVLDTWFSSALWPFATLGWPQDTPELRYYYPTDLLITDRQIRNLWVNRMVFSSLEFLHQVPFPVVFVHPTVLNYQGRRMSKSLGTGVDPTELMERYGADATRFGLLMQCSLTQDIRFSQEPDPEAEGGWRYPGVEMGRNFCNKVWNATRLLLLNLDQVAPVDDAQVQELVAAGTLPDRWIASRFARAAQAATEALAGYRMDDYARKLYDFFWSELCDWYLEMVKPRLRAQADAERQRTQRLLVYLFDRSLRLLHPMIPFVTEELWQALPHEGESVMMAPWPLGQARLQDEAAEAQMSLLMELVTTARRLRVEQGVAPGARVAVTLASADQELLRLAGEQADLVGLLARAAGLELLPLAQGQPPPPGAALLTWGEAAGYLVIAATLSPEDRCRERERLRAELGKLEAELARARSKLADPDFLEKAPPPVVAKVRDQQAELETKVAAARGRLAALGE